CGEAVAAPDDPHLAVVDAGTGLAFPEEVADVHPEHREDPEEGVERDLVFAILHAAQIRLLHADARGEPGLGQVALLAKLTDLAADENGLSPTRIPGCHRPTPC